MSSVNIRSRINLFCKIKSFQVQNNLIDRTCRLPQTIILTHPQFGLSYFHITLIANVLHYYPVPQRSKVTDTLRKKILMNPTQTLVMLMLMMMRKMRMREGWLRRTEIQTMIPRVHRDRRGTGLGTAGRNKTTLPMNRQERERTMSNTRGTRKGTIGD